MANTPKKTPAKSAAKPTTADKKTADKKPAVGAKPPAPKKEPVVKTAATFERPKLKRGKTHSGERAAEIVIRPTVKIVREEADVAVVAWGRMNPPTIGHGRLVEAVSEIAAERAGYPMLFLSGTMNMKNPLSLNERMSLVEDAFGDLVNVQEAAGVKDPISLLKHVNETFKKVVVVTGKEHEADYVRFFETYNGTEFQFDEMELVILERSSDSDIVEHTISATKMRAYALEGNAELFEAGLPQALKMDAEYIMEQVRYGMSMQEAASSDNPATRAIAAYRNKRV